MCPCNCTYNMNMILQHAALHWYIILVLCLPSFLAVQNIIPHLPGFDPYREPPPVVESNWFVAFQAMTESEHWLGCNTRGCGTSTCGGRLLDFDEWRNCYGQVFKVYRRDGPGAVRVGDYVSFLQFRTDLWLDCESQNCALSRCGGEVSNTGFDDRSKWCECSGSAFRLASFNKTIGTPIYGGEPVMLYSVTEDSYISLGLQVASKTTCPGSRFPPPGDRFDECSHAVFRLHY